MGVIEIIGVDPDYQTRGVAARLTSSARRHTAGFRAAWATGVVEPSGAVMVPVVCADGRTRSFASHIFPIRDPHGELLAVCAAWSPPHERDASLRLLD
jgi:hypothetical protein